MKQHPIVMLLDVDLKNDQHMYDCEVSQQRYLLEFYEPNNPRYHLVMIIYSQPLLGTIGNVNVHT